MGSARVLANQILADCQEQGDKIPDRGLSHHHLIFMSLPDFYTNGVQIKSDVRDALKEVRFLKKLTPPLF